MKLLVDHRHDLVDERRGMHQRLRWHLHRRDPDLAVPLRMLARASHLERVGRWLAPQADQVRVRIARASSSAGAAE
jgi:transposase